MMISSFPSSPHFYLFSSISTNLASAAYYWKSNQTRAAGVPSTHTPNVGAPNTSARKMPSPPQLEPFSFTLCFRFCLFPQNYSFLFLTVSSNRLTFLLLLLKKWREDKNKKNPRTKQNNSFEWMNNHVESWRCERWDHRYGTIPVPESSARAPCKKIQRHKMK